MLKSGRNRRGCAHDRAGPMRESVPVYREPELRGMKANQYRSTGIEGDFCEYTADSDDVARSFRDHVARYSDMMSPA